MAEEVEESGANALEGTEAAAPENPEITQVPESGENENPEISSAAPDATPEPEAAPERVHGNKGRVPWQTHRINEETNKRILLQEELAKERREKAEALALLEQKQGGGEKVAPHFNEPDIEALVEARAAKKLFDADCNQVAMAWKSASGTDFDQHISTLGSVGLLPNKDGSNTEFMMDIFAVDRANAHKILDLLAQDPDRALEMTRMDSRRRIAELTRMTMATEKPAAPAPKPAAVSRVPAPKPVIDPAGGVEDVEEDKMSDEQWASWRKKQLSKSA